MAKRKRVSRSRLEPGITIAESDLDRHCGGPIVSAAQEKLARDFLDRLEAWAKNHQQDDEMAFLRGPELILSGSDVFACIEAAERAVRWIESMRREARALAAAHEVLPSLRSSAYSAAHQAGRFELPKTKRSHRAVLATYLSVLDVGASPMLSGIGQPWWETTAEPNLAERFVRVAQRTPQEALEVTMKVWRFDSLGACRAVLRRAQAEVRRNRNGWRAAFPVDFEIPQAR